MDPEAYPWHPTHNHNLAHEYSNPLTHKLPGDCYHRYEPKVIQLVRLQCNGGLGDSLLNVVQLQERKAFAQIDPIPWFYYPGMRFRIQVLIVILLNKLIIRGEKDMLDKKQMDRINELAKMAKERDLTSEEKKEQEQLRKEYLAKFRKSFRKRLDNIDIEYID